MKDICFYVADKSMMLGIEGVLSILFPDKKSSEFCDFYVDPHHDPGVYKNAGDFLRNFSKQYRFAMVLLDHEGSGQEKKTCEEIEEKIENELVNNGWKKENVKVIVLNPELEIWLWVESRTISEDLGWDNYQELKNKLISKGFWENGETKPKKPKESIEYALRGKKIPRSSSLYKKIAEHMTLEVFQKCQDTAFRKFMETLERWYDQEWI